MMARPIRVNLTFVFVMTNEQLKLHHTPPPPTPSSCLVYGFFSYLETHDRQTERRVVDETVRAVVVVDRSQGSYI